MQLKTIHLTFTYGASSLKKNICHTYWILAVGKGGWGELFNKGKWV